MKKNFKILIFFLLCLFLVPQVFAATQTQRPDADDSQVGTWTRSSGTLYYVLVNEAVADDATYITADALLGGVANNLFGFPVFSVPAGATINNLTIYFRHTRTMGTALKVGGTVYNDAGSVSNVGVNFTDRSWVYTTNPKTGVAWTTAEVNGVDPANALQAFGVYTNDITPKPDVSQVYAVVTYTVPNFPPVGGYTSDNVIPAAQCTQATDGSGLITINFRVKDANLDPCTLKTFQYSTDGGGGWSAPNNGDASASLSSGWTNNSGSNYTSAADFTGPVYSFTFNTKHADVSGINGTDQNDIRIRFTVNDGALDSTSPTASENFSVDDLDPATLTATDIAIRPSAGDTAVTLASSFTEIHPNTNTFYVAYNGGAYGSGSAGDSNTAAPSSHSTPVGATLDGNDYISKVKCDHVDDFGNSGTNENLAPSTNGVKPYTPPPPTVSNPGGSTVDVAVNKNASEATGLSYAIYESSQAKWVQADGSLGAAEVYQTIAAWGTKTVTGLSAPVSNYVFQAKSRNPNGDQPTSDLSGGASSANSAPVLNCGATENSICIPSQATDRSGKITITFRIKDLDLDNCSVVSGSFQYQVNSAGWNNILDADITGTKTGLASAADLNGPTHTLVWDTSKEYIDDALSQNVQIRFKVNDGTADSIYGVSPTGFNVDNLDPAPLVTTDIATQPDAGDTTITLDCSFTEQNPNTNTFYVAINGGGYGSGTSGDTGTADPSPQATSAGATLDGNDYINKVKCTHVDDFGNIGDNENLSPESAKKFVKPYTPAIPTVDEGAATTVDVRINKNPNETTGLKYAIYVSSHAKYVQTDGTLGNSAAWQTIPDWGTKTVTGLISPVSDYVFKTKSRNPSDTAYQASSESNLSDGANTSGLLPTPEAIVSYYPPAGAENVTPEANVIVVFDRDMDTTLVENIFSMRAVYDNQGNITDEAVSGSFSWAANRTLTFVPSSSLKKGYTYRVALSGNAEDYDGNPLTIDLNWSFRVILDRQIQNVFVSSDGRAMVVLSVDAIPNDGSVDIDRDPINRPREVDPIKILEANNKVLAEENPYFHPINFSITELNGYGTDDIRITIPFANTVTVTLYYDDENQDGYVDGEDPKVLERSLAIYRLDEVNSLWVRVPTSAVNTSQNYVSATIPYFAVYTLMATPAYSLSEAHAFPNPYRPSEGHTDVTFTNLSSECKIMIFTLTGDNVITIVENDGDGQATWDVKNRAGEELASGLYLYAIESAQDKKMGKLVIIK